ncbi:MAG: HAMP domain-containing protein [bacterium]|nr:HAMP domain-containing protein [bacterium]
MKNIRAHGTHGKTRKNKRVPRRGFFVRTFTSYVIIILMVFVLIFLFSQGTIRNFYIENLETRLKQVGHALMPKAVELYDEADIEGMDRLAKEVGQQVDMRITVITPSGTVIADSENDPGEMENHGDRPEIIQALKGKMEGAGATRFSSTMGEQMLYLALPVEREGDARFVIRLSLYLSHISELIRALRWKFTGLLLVLFLFAILIAWYFSRGISKPVREIAAATREFASGNFDVKIFLEKKDELADVADSFNHMVTTQKKLFNKLSQNRAELQAIISSMKEGLIVIDPMGKITLCNESFEEIACKKEMMGNPYWEVLRIPDFEEYVKKSFQSRESFYEEVELNNKTFLVGFNRMKKGEKLVVIFRDISEFKQLERMKKDFIVNLTHELKTPLTAIKGFVETLEEEENIENTQYMEIIKRHTDRMNQIVSDLLVLSELEEKNRDVLFEGLDLDDMVNNILKIYKERLKEKDLELEIDIPGNLPKIRGERFKMEQMFINLVDNAVKYTDEGKISITIGETEDGKRVKIEVGNTGLSIPEKSIPRLFERFYVVDKGRSRKLGGTGLGLSIVKHVVLLHKGEISVESTNQEGTVFTIYLPL